MFQPLADFQEEHVAQERAFRAHQAAVIALDLDSAEARLADFTELLMVHMAVEEDILLPVFAERAAALPRMGAEMFRDDHAKLRRSLVAVRTELAALRDRPTLQPEDVIDLLDRELAFKRLLHHHDDRERQGFFPLLDEALTTEELHELWETVSAALLQPGE